MGKHVPGMHIDARIESMLLVVLAHGLGLLLTRRPDPASWWDALPLNFHVGIGCGRDPCGFA
jgi:hypothetical protein